MSRLYVTAVCAEAFAATEPLPDLKSLLQQRCSRKPRRTNRLTDLSLLGALQCAAGLEPPGGERTGLYLASCRGNVGDTVDLLQQVLEQGVEPMPLTFINVSNNMAGYYVAQQLGLSGRSLALSAGLASFDRALDLALLDLECGAVEQALVGAVEEATLPLDGLRAAFAIAPEQGVAESSAWLLLSRKSTGALAEVRICRQYSQLQQLLEAVAVLPSAGYYVAVEALPAALTSALEVRGVRPLGGESPGYNESISPWRLLDALQRGEGDSLLYLRGDATQGFFVLQLECLPH